MGTRNISLKFLSHIFSGIHQLSGYCLPEIPIGPLEQIILDRKNNPASVITTTRSPSSFAQI
jgi:hypothetical protein